MFLPGDSDGRYQAPARPDGARGITDWSGLVWRSGLVAALHFVWPLLLLYAALTIPAWQVIVLFQPDLGSWLEVVAAIVFLKGWLELALIWRALRQARPRPRPQPV